MMIQEWFLALAIAIIYSLFFSKLSDIMTDRSTIDRMCDGLMISYPVKSDMMTGTPQNEEAINACYKNQQSQREKAETYQFYILLTIGIVSLIFSIWMRQGAASSGLSFGSIIILIIATSMYWNQMGELMKLGTTGIALVVLLAVSMKMFNLNSF